MSAPSDPPAGVPLALPAESGVIGSSRLRPLAGSSAHGVAGTSYRLYGPANAPVVLVLGGISADRHLAACTDDPRPGWWQDVVGDGLAVDTRRFRVLGLDYVEEGSSTGQSGESVPGTYGQAEVIAAALDALGIDRLHAAVGASYGGMVTLALAERHASRLCHAVVISAAHESHPMATALRSIQRRIVRLGLEVGDGREGLRIARALAMTTYRTAEEFAERFDGAPVVTSDGPRFPVETYLEHCGDRFVESFTAQRFLRMSEALDMHRVDARSIHVPVTLVAIDDDTLVPAWQMGELARLLRTCLELHALRSRYGHDAFLKEASVAECVSAALRRGLPRDTE